MSFHQNNPHQGQYYFEALVAICPELSNFIKDHPYQSNKKTLNFADANAVMALNKALIKYHYQIDWSIPKGYLCPPVPSRADYVYHIADLLRASLPPVPIAIGITGSYRNQKLPKGYKIRGLDIGIGANAIYAIVGNRSYGWSYIGSDIDKKALENVTQIIQKNQILKDKIEVRLQTASKYIFKNIITAKERFDFTICNPPFHSSKKAAQRSSQRKSKNLNSSQNFKGQANELWCEGGELQFIKTMIAESEQFKFNCYWFTTLVSKKENLKPLLNSLEQTSSTTVKVIKMQHGNKKSRILCWTFLNDVQRKQWSKMRWK